jgi:hypothetical protein
LKTFPLADFDIPCPSLPDFVIQAGGQAGLFCYFLKKNKK